MTLKRRHPDELLGFNKFEVDDEQAHIVLNKAECLDCRHKACLYICPAGLYSLQNETIVFDYAGCLECGTCRIICPHISWKYPRGTMGICYRYG